ncbi:anaerobic ribonucleoside-triphosphate reductase [Weissella paramesenteroides]|uniref:anaerobic ribonucleoside-triphosphate reductase n=1 Tax=Weissella paramesenteroides TaxID=1249 RepID=UPI00123947DC|nr:anaerobic ribonucleoside-triphosphate reductase [Weissella paramesenteroides]KAA8458099.1 anaerobic ribonucleoside-triphosphate reductase [Weissella paramesenteroides]KAA8458686.1 anaerobic ribonucleoside-triphosphate reductase [Weissella paramesenteroides]KAA8459340.1 anaerobic ribonucleoside-triphosphate reductase [Weissella paramesenteroides]KAA8463338.1 anaerobic ribonucleoside-triphosphate reductase [Weissella paramesenteroides]KAA8463825.1 anaerobic ribonucleoside-triphosphate reducta
MDYVETVQEIDWRLLKQITVEKSDGEKTPFYAYKIDLVIDALTDNDELKDELRQRIFSQVSEAGDELSSTTIRDMFISALISMGEVALADKYVDYRTHDIEKWESVIDPGHKLNQLFNGQDTVVHENANKDSNIFSTRRDLTAGMVGKSLGLTLMPQTVAKAHLRGDIHYHDLDYSPLTSMTNCCLIDFKDMLANGFKIGNANVEPPKSIQTATAQMSQIIANVASSQYGGCSSDRTDEVLAPYAELNYKKHLAEAEQWVLPEKRESFARDKTKKDIYDAMQALEYEVNTLFSSNGQTPFTTVGFGLGTSWIEREIQKAILQVRIKGLGKQHQTAIFPKLIFTVKRGLNLDKTDPNYDVKQLAVECATKRMYPDILMYDKIIELTGSFKCPMGCRSFLQGWQDENGQEVNSGRMNLGVVTINLPRIAIEAKGDKDVFWEIMDDRVHLAKKALLNRLSRCKEAKPENAPILYENGAFGKRLQPTDSVDELFKNSRATISLGYIGLYEVGTAFYGSEWEDNQEAHDFTVAIVKYLHDYCLKWENQYGYHFSVYSTPAESLTDTFCEDDIARFGMIPDITAKEYYTNSFHYDVRKNPTPFEKLAFEQDYPKYAAGGFIHYCEYPNLKQNPAALEAVWDWAYDRVGYLGTNASIDHCFKCGFDGEFKPTARGFECPQCGNRDPKTCDVVKRTCGYLGNPMIRPMVHGRHKEIVSRVKHMQLGGLEDGEI